jgi:hypothetical protein
MNTSTVTRTTVQLSSYQMNDRLVGLAEHGSFLVAGLSFCVQLSQPACLHRGWHFTLDHASRIHP